MTKDLKKELQNDYNTFIEFLSQEKNLLIGLVEGLKDYVDDDDVPGVYLRGLEQKLESNTATKKDIDYFIRSLNIDTMEIQMYDKGEVVLSFIAKCDLYRISEEIDITLRYGKVFINGIWLDDISKTLDVKGYSEDCRYSISRNEFY